MEWVTQRYYSYNSIIRALHNHKTGEKDNLRLPLFKPEKSYDIALIIGGGPNANLHAEAVKRFISQQTSVCIIHASSKNAKSYEDIMVDQYFCLVGNEGHRLEEVINNLNHFSWKCILPAYPRKMGTYIPEIAQNASTELESVSFTDKYKDSHTAIALQTALAMNAKKLFLTGYDGYHGNLITSKEQGLISENEYLFETMPLTLKPVSLTPTKYPMEVQSVYSLVK
jgi:4-hydroxy 2-oxovalerate aldolase